MGERDDDSERSLGSLLRELLSALAESGHARRATGSGHSDIGSTRVDHEFSIGIGTLADGTDRPTSTSTRDHPTSVHYDESGDGATVVVDLGAEDLTPETLAGGVTAARGEPVLAVADDEGVLERVPLRHADFEIVESWFNNGVLELRLLSTEDTTS